jgi:hypothetical protein
MLLVEGGAEIRMGARDLCVGQLGWNHEWVRQKHENVISKD